MTLASHHPLQAICCSRTGSVVAASGSVLSVVSPSPPLLVAQSGSHKGIVRLLCTYYEPETGLEYLISACDEKILVISELPSLLLRSKRELVKRANALSIDLDGTIIVGDKFGDVYSLPLHDAKVATKPNPILGHVSMVNCLAYIPPSSAQAKNALVITGDRDAHVRVSRFPQGYVIERYIWGSKLFVSALLHLPIGPSRPKSIVMVAGGDPTLSAYEVETGKLVASISIQDSLMPYVIVNPIAPPPVPAGKHKDKRGERVKGGGGIAQIEGLLPPEVVDPTLAASVEPENVLEEGNGVEQEEAENSSSHPSAQKGNTTSRQSRHKWKDGSTPGFAVLKMVLVKDCAIPDEEGILVVVTGATAVLYVPLRDLLPPKSTSSPKSDAEPVLLDCRRPILDIAVDSGRNRIWLSRDLSRGSPQMDSPSPPFPDDSPVLCLSISNRSFIQDEEMMTQISATWTKAQIEVTDLNPYPDAHALYPVLQQLEPPPPSELDHDHELTAVELDESQESEKNGDGMTKMKRSIGLAFNDQVALESRAKSGRRAKGRLDAQMRLEEAHRKAAEAIGWR